LEVVDLRVTVEAKERALLNLSNENLPAVIRQRSHFECELFLGGIVVVKRQCGQTATVAAQSTASSEHLHEKALPLQAALLLCFVAKVTGFVFAGSRAKTSFSTCQWRTTYHTLGRVLRKHDVVSP
jgi:hypothetical protein